MTLLDIILVLLLLLFAAVGFRLGALHAVGGVVGFVVGLMIADTYYIGLSQKLSMLNFGHELILKMVVYGLIVAISSRVVGLVFWFIEKLVGILPLLGTFNLVIGAFAGFLEGALIMGFVLSMLVRYPSITVVTQELSRSRVSPIIIQGFSVLTNLLPQEFQKLEPINLEKWRQVQTMVGDRWKQYQNLRGAEGVAKLKELDTLLP